MIPRKVYHFIIIYLILFWNTRSYKLIKGRIYEIDYWFDFFLKNKNL